jgi:cytochrome P450
VGRQLVGHVGAIIASRAKGCEDEQIGVDNSVDRDVGNGHPDPGEFNYPDPAILACPYPFYQALHAHARIYKVPGRNDYLVSRYDDVILGLRETGVLSNRREFAAAADPELEAIAARQRYPVVPAVIDTDPPLHKSRRALLFSLFTPAKLRRYQAQILRQVDELIDGFIDRGNAEFVSEFALELPIRVICDLLDFDRSMRPQIKKWSVTFTEAVAQFDSRARQLEVQNEFVDFYDFLGDEVEKRLQRPGDDILSELVQSRYEDGSAPDAGVLVNMLRNIVVAGHETTTSMLASSLLLLLRHPAHYHAVAADFSRIPRLLEEALRLESPSQWVPRMAIHDFSIDGVTVPAGARVLLLVGAANRDPRHFDDPDTIRLDRSNLKDHVAFGYGIHFCLGAPLARLEGRVAFERLLSRLSGLALAPGAEVAPVGAAMMYHLERLPITFERT